MVAGRGQGKSVTAIRWLLERSDGSRVLLVANADRKHHLSRLALRMLPGSQATKEFIDRYVRPHIIIADTYNHTIMRDFANGREIGIDDAEEVLRILFRGRVELATFNATLIPVVGGMTVNGDFIDGEQTSVDGIRPHRYPRSPEEHAQMKALAEATPLLGRKQIDWDTEPPSFVEVDCKCVGFSHREECPNWTLPV